MIVAYVYMFPNSPVNTLIWMKQGYQHLCSFWVHIMYFMSSSSSQN